MSGSVRNLCLVRSGCCGGGEITTTGVQLLSAGKGRDKLSLMSLTGLLFLFVPCCCSCYKGRSEAFGNTFWQGARAKSMATRWSVVSGRFGRPEQGLKSARCAALLHLWIVSSSKHTSTQRPPTLLAHPSPEFDEKMRTFM